LTDLAATRGSRWDDPTGTVIDAHNDLLLELVHRRGEPHPFRDRWLDQLARGGVALQVCPLYAWWEEIGERALRSALEQVSAMRRAVAENPEVAEVRSREDLERAIEGDRLALVLSIEGAEVIGNDPQMLDLFHELGVRMIGLTHFQRNAYADGNGEPAQGGLSALGRELLARIEALDMVLDLAHASDRTFADALESAPTAPTAISHTGCRALCDTPRNASDEQLRAVAERGGVVGIYAVPYFLGGEDPRSLDRVADHVLHALEVAGPEHVGLGGDFTHQLFETPGLVRTAPWMGIDQERARETVVGLAGPDGYPSLVEALRRRGIDGPVLAGVLHENFLRLLRSALPAEAAAPTTRKA
jgi:membrane dipeptidase